MEDHISYERRIPIKYSVDVAVIGGGIAGISAACAAADEGAEVLLVERFATLGGNATSGGVGAFCGNTRGQGKIFDQIISELEKFKAVAPYDPRVEYAREFNPEILALVLQRLLLGFGVKLLLHTRFIDAEASGGRVGVCVLAGKSGLWGVRAKQFIDCSGDGDLAAAAGCEIMNGRPGDGLKLPMSLMYFVRHLNGEEMADRYLPEGYFDEISSDDELPMTSVWPNGPRSNAIKIKIPLFDAADTEELTRAEIYARERMMQVLAYYQRKKNKAWMLDHCSPQIGIREGRRVIGDYILTVDDLYAGRTFEDAVATGNFYLDAHKLDDDKRTYVLPPDKRSVPPYQIPMRALTPRGLDNLLAAGRCFSADQLALSSARVMPTCSMMGQAAGRAAAVCAKENMNTRELETARLRSLLERNGAVLELDKLFK